MSLNPHFCVLSFFLHFKLHLWSPSLTSFIKPLYRQFVADCVIVLFLRQWNRGRGCYTPPLLNHDILELSARPSIEGESWGASSQLCWFSNKAVLCITHTVQHNYIYVLVHKESNNYMFPSYLWTIFSLSINYRICHTNVSDIWLVREGGGGLGNEISLFESWVSVV